MSTSNKPVAPRCPVNRLILVGLLATLVALGLKSELLLLMPRMVPEPNKKPEAEPMPLRSADTANQYPILANRAETVSPDPDPVKRVETTTQSPNQAHIGKTADKGQIWTRVIDTANQKFCDALPRLLSKRGVSVESPSFWRNALTYIAEAMRIEIGDSAISGDMYQFGVFQGNSMLWFHKHFATIRMIGFDSFQGLPQESASVQNFNGFGQGTFNSGDTRAQLTKLIGESYIKFVTGFYQNSLTAGLRQQLSLTPAFFIDMDADLYISSVQALSYMFKAKLVRVGTLVGYDDWWEAACYHNSSDIITFGEARAHVEIAHQYGVKFRCVAGSCARPAGGFFRGESIFNTDGPIFVVLGIGGSVETGVQTSKSDVLDFMSSSKRCRAWSKRQLI